MPAVAVVIAALLIVIAAALWLELRAERQAAVLASYLLDAAARDEPPASLGWGPGGLVRLPPRTAFRPCGGLDFEGGICFPCLAHDPAFEPPADPFAAEIGDDLGPRPTSASSHRPPTG